MLPVSKLLIAASNGIQNRKDGPLHGSHLRHDRKIAGPGFSRGWRKPEKGSLSRCPERLLQGREGGMGGG
jgi:hypothetical protein